MTTRTLPAHGSWPISLAVGVALGWFAVLALAIWLGSNGPRPIAAWFVAYPMFALYPGVAALAASRATSPSVVTTLATLIPMAALWLTFQPNAFQQTPFGIRDDRVEYGIYTLVHGLGLVVAIGTGSRLIRCGSNVLGFLAAGLIFVGVAVFAFYVLLSVTMY